MQTATPIFIPDLSPHLDKIKAENEAKRFILDLKNIMTPVAPFPASEMTDAAREERLEKAKNDFWFFDKTYFPKSIYKSYFSPGWFHKQIIEFTYRRDKKIIVIAGPRDVAKTLHLKKRTWHMMMFGERELIGFGSEIMTTSYRFLTDTKFLLQNNERIKFDFNLQFMEESTEGIFLRSRTNPKGTFLIPFSAERSTKGAQRLMSRLDYFHVTDLENSTSSLTKDAIENRIDTLNEARTSLSDDGIGIWEGNNFDPDCAMNHLVEEKEKGILSENIEVYCYPAWETNRRPQSLWHTKYPAKSEEQMKDLMKPLDEYDWAGNFQTHPKKKSGNIFPKDNYREWDFIPKDLKSVTYTDPNCSLKTKGDTTAVTCLGWSPTVQKFYITTARCKSYSSSNDLLRDFLMMLKEFKELARIIDSAFDGNVAQESQWDNNIRNFARLSGFPFPPIAFKKYRVDDLSSPVEAEWKADKFLFPPGFIKTKEGKEYMKQTFAFSSKKAKKKDDAPDSLICAYTFLVEKGIAHATKSLGVEFHSVSQRQIHKI